MSDALAAALMATQRRKTDPVEQQRKYGQLLMQQGASTEPVRTPLQGLARALTGAAGGVFEGLADRQEKADQSKTTSKLGRMLSAKTSDEIASIAKEDGGDMEMIAPIMGQLITQKMADARKAELGTRNFNALGAVGGAPSATGAPAAPASPGGEGGPVINMTPLPQGTVAPGAFNNNVGNLRTSPAAWDGKGVPQNGFETFATPQQGVNAAFGNLGAYVKANPNITVAQAIAKWAPPNENNTQQYISQVAEGTGINPAAPLAEIMKDPAVSAQLLDAITRKEKGGLPQGVTADTFMAATGGAPPPAGAPAAPPPQQVAQAGAVPPQGAGEQPATQAPPLPPLTPPSPGAQAAPMPTVSPAAAEFDRQAQDAFKGGDIDRAVALRQKAQEEQAKYTGERAKTQDERAYKQGEEKDKRTYDQTQLNVQNEAKAREQFDQIQQIKDYRKANNVFRSALDGDKANTPAGDLNMIYAFATLMDPGSVVREGEMSMVKGTQTVGDLVRSMSSYVDGGSRLSPKARSELLAMMGSRYESYKTAHDDLAKTFGGIAERSGMNPQNVVVSYPAVPYTRKDIAAPPTGAPTPPKVGDVQDGHRFKGGNPADPNSWEVAQ